MLREFVRCNRLEDRIDMIRNSVPSDWTESELATAAEIAGATEKVKDLSAEDALKVIAGELSRKLEEEKNDDTFLQANTRLLEEEDAVGTTGTEEAYEKMDGLIAAVNLNQSFPQ